MDLMTRRRALMALQNTEPEWDYVLYAEASGAIHPVQVTISAGQRVVLEWGTITVKNNNYRLWALKDGGKFVGIQVSDCRSADLEDNGKRTYTVETGGTLIIGGFQLQNYAWYSLHADVLKARIT